MINQRISIVVTRAFGVFATFAFVANIFLSSQNAVAASSGEKIFQDTCAGCHMGGQNVIDPKKPIIGSKLLANPKSFKAFLSKAHNPMPSFAKIANNEAELSALLAYCKTLK